MNKETFRAFYLVVNVLVVVGIVAFFYVVMIQGSSVTTNTIVTEDGAKDANLFLPNEESYETGATSSEGPFILIKEEKS